MENDALPRDPEITAMERLSEVLADLHDEDPGAVGRVLRWARDRFEAPEISPAHQGNRPRDADGD